MDSQYKLIVANSVAEFEDKCNNASKEGFEPLHQVSYDEYFEDYEQRVEIHQQWVKHPISVFDKQKDKLMIKLMEIVDSLPDILNPRSHPKTENQA